MKSIVLFLVSICFMLLFSLNAQEKIKKTVVRKKAAGRKAVKSAVNKKKKFARRSAVTGRRSKKSTVNDEWEFFSPVFMPGAPSSATLADCYGIRVGLPISFGKKVCGIETGVLCAMTDNVYGLQCSPICCLNKNISGLQASPVNFADNVDGVQFGIVNISKKSGFQFGLVNYIEDAAIPLLPIINFKF